MRILLTCPVETPPRAWGRHPDSMGKGFIKGNTPTGVGKTCNRAHRLPYCRKHPHGRGEDKTLMQTGDEMGETPPRAWGRLLSGGCCLAVVGNTPTGVGKTCCNRSQPYPQRKHPHGRGEDGNASLYSPITPETPPRAWGRLSQHMRDGVDDRNTPTGVGKTRPKACPYQDPRKHPHGRGEDHTPADSLLIALETPPRAWGRL